MLSSPMNYLLPGLLFSCGGWVMPGGKWIVPMTKTFYSVLSKVQGIYTLITAVWPIADIDSFMEVTGPKTDVWLVKTVAAILIPVGLCFIFASKVKRDFWLIFLLGITTTSALATIDFYYTGVGTISGVYALDGVLQVFFLLCWVILCFRYQKSKTGFPGRHGW